MPKRTKYKVIYVDDYNRMADARYHKALSLYVAGRSKTAPKMSEYFFFNIYHEPIRYGYVVVGGGMAHWFRNKGPAEREMLKLERNK